MTLEQVFRKRGVEFRQGVQPNEIKVCCPFCSDRGETPDRRFRLGINTRTGQGHCFNCNWKSRGTAVAKLLRRLAIDENVRGTEVNSGSGAPEVRLPEDFQLLSWPPSDMFDRQAISYLQKRGVTMKQTEQCHVGISLSGTYAYRVIFPIRFRKKLLSFVARDFTGGSTRRYLNSSGGDKGLFHLPEKVQTVLLCEGIFKALRLEQALPHVVCCATLGHSMTQFQHEQLRLVGCKHVVVWPDPDKPGLDGARETAVALRSSFQVEIIWPSMMADEATLKEMQTAWCENRLVMNSWERPLRLGVATGERVPNREALLKLARGCV